MIVKATGLGAATVLTLLSACAAPRAIEANGEAVASPASRLARDMLAADAAFEAGDRAALAAAVKRIERQGPRLIDGDAPDPVRRWRAALPDAGPPLRGRALGPGYARGTLAPGAARRMDQLFLSGQAATVAANSRPQKNLRLKIFDRAGKLVCDRSPAHTRDCRFTPVFTQRYRIEIVNGGAATAHYYLVVD
ncbi:hypothetical protein DFR49_2945 [Hephaestia caeni]|uniref:Lipoprotein n=1 Tax=Hephaestia caeni TaxID=645617 RepID=A0A397P553_9SPHN|nr:hypothetical protein [Hephaestia caeni]RIA44686.1 hypothetical protein DFR49_2945 [Hephaestia caeni]